MSSDTDTSNNFDMVIFGGTGDLALKKLLPALFYCELDERLAPGRIYCVSRTEMSRESYISQIKESLVESLGDYYEADAWQRFEDRIDYVLVDVTVAESFSDLGNRLKVGSNESKDRIFYFAMAPDLFGVLAENLSGAGLINERTRVVLEKPLGHDLASSRVINDQIARVFEERQVFRIDHYLGKETVQPSGHDKTSLLVSARNRPGALLGLLRPFEENGISLTRIDSRPSKTEKWTYVFYIECEGHLADDVMVEVIGQIEEHSIMLKRLGSYPRAPI